MSWPWTNVSAEISNRAITSHIICKELPTTHDNEIECEDPSNQGVNKAEKLMAKSSCLEWIYQSHLRGYLANIVITLYHIVLAIIGFSWPYNWPPTTTPPLVTEQAAHLQSGSVNHDTHESSPQ